jgi:hypothetical protein
MAHFNLADYETVEDRLVKFWNDHPDGRIATMMEDITADKTMVVFRCDVYFHADDHKAKASGYAEETRNSSPVNKTSFVENCETSAIGRALANCGYAAKSSRPSREEMEKVQRVNASQPAPVVSFTTATEQHHLTNGQVSQMFPGSTVVASEPKPAPVMKNPDASASPKQVGLIKSIVRGQGMTEAEGSEYAGVIVGRAIASLNDISMGEASKLITALKAVPVAPALSPEKPF